MPNKTTILLCHYHRSLEGTCYKRLCSLLPCFPTTPLFVPWALEAAHIIPYRDSQSDSAKNGLLLRCDLHSLFESGHLAVKPDSKQVFLSAEARVWEGYTHLHGGKLAGPQPGFEHDAPKNAAFRKLWSKFIKNHPEDV
jgi:HNH endonuclease